ncbi:hypothetical protein BSKO_12237 [Bryopsis sp. KO-2023]|nr:hypothetical protein BSKO_12237 [Bryopsis sp. KO-2023]
METASLENAARDLPFEILAEKVTPELLAENEAWSMLKDKAVQNLESGKKSFSPFTRLERLAATRVLDQLGMLWRIREAKKENISIEDENDKVSRLNMHIVVRATEDCEVEDALLGQTALLKGDVRPLPYNSVRPLLESGSVEVL